MPDTAQRRRVVSPAVLLVVLLCFFLPFFSVSCSSGVGQVTATVTGMDQVVGGEPEYTGFRPPPTSAAATDDSRVSPAAVLAVAAIVVGIGLGLGLPRPGARWLSGAVASGIALVAVVANQVAVHSRAQEALGGVESSFRAQLGNNPIFGGSIPAPVFELDDEPGFWIVTVLLALVLAYNVYEVVASRRAPDRTGAPADGFGGSHAPPFPQAPGAPGWSPAPPPQGARPGDGWSAPRYPDPRPQGPASGYPDRDR